MAGLPPSALDLTVARATRADARRVAEGLANLMKLMRRMALDGQSLLGAMMGPQTQVRAWAHWPPDDAHDARTGYRWYYHCHAREARMPGEHGHFHLFSDPRSGSRVTHLVAISVSNRGLPLGLLTTNRWVTDEHWQSAPRVLSLIESFVMTSPRAMRRVHAWLSSALKAFGPQVRALIRRRDERLEALRRSARSDVMEDRRIAVLSRCAIDVTRQAAALDRRLSGNSL